MSLPSPRDRARVAADFGLTLAESGFSEEATLDAAARLGALGLADVCVVSRLQDDGRTLRAGAVWSDDTTLRDAVWRSFSGIDFSTDSPGLTGRAMATGSVVHAGGSQSELAEAVHPAVESLVREFGAHDVAVAPMGPGAEPVGALTVVRVGETPGYSEEELAFLGELAGRAGMAITNARLHEAVRVGEQRYRRLVDADVVGVISGEGDRIVDANDAFLDMLGYTRDDLEGGRLRWPDLTPPEWAAADAGSLADRGSSEWSARYEKEYFHADGHRVPVLIAGTEVSRDPFRWIVVVLDLSERKAAESAMRQSEERFREAVEHAPVGGVIVCLEPGRVGELLWVNRAFAMLSGRDAAELTAMSLADLVHPDDRDHDRAALEELAGGFSATMRREKRYLRPDGSTLWVRINAARLPGARQAIAYVEDISPEKQAAEELAWRATHDPLTGLANRHLFADRLRLALAQLNRDPRAVAVLYLDIDRFKDINDALGHDSGDLLIREVGARLGRVVRAPDTAARLAGDEFAVVCAVDDEADAVTIAQRVHRAVGQPVVLGELSTSVSVSIGVATTREGSTPADELVHNADAAMYEAKRRGRRRWHVYDEALHDDARRRLEVLGWVRDALDLGWVTLHYQPVIDLRSGGIVGAEALCRIEHPVYGVQLPDSFLGVAEDSDVIGALGLSVLRQGCAQLGRWRDDAVVDGSFRLAVNVSTRQAASIPIGREISAAADAAGVPLDALSLEVTEQVLLDIGESTVGELQRLTERGMGLALDDFGTGYSSLTHLKRFPVDTVKIDRTFVGGIGRDPSDTAIVTAMSALARGLGLTLVAEGVETSEQADELRRLGCDHAQGFLFGRPLPAEELTELLHRSVTA